MTTHIVSALTTPGQHPSFKTYKLPYEIDTFADCQKMLSLDAPADIKKFFMLVSQCSLKTQVTNPKAHAIVNTVSNYPEYKKFLKTGDIPGAAAEKQTVIKQWLTLAKQCLHHSAPSQQASAIFRLITAVKATSHLSNQEKESFISLLNQVLPSELLGLLAQRNHLNMLTLTQSSVIQQLAQLYLTHHTEHTAQEKNTLKTILLFNEKVALILMRRLLNKLTPFPAQALITLLHCDEINLTQFNVLIAHRPLAEKNRIRIYILTHFPVSAQDVKTLWANEFTYLSQADRTATQACLRRHPQLRKQLASVTTALDACQQPFHPIEGPAHIPNTWARWGLLFPIKAVYLAELYRSFYTKLTGQFLHFFGQQPDPYTPYYEARLTALKTLLMTLDTEALAAPNTNAFQLLLNSMTVLTEPHMLPMWAEALTKKRPQAFFPALNQPNPLKHLGRASWDALKACWYRQPPPPQP